MRKIGSFFAKNWIRMLISLALATGLMFIYVSNMSKTFDAWTHLECYRDGATIGGFVLIFFGLLAMTANFGTFDALSFYFRRKKKENGYKENYGDYVERRNKERGSFNLFFLSYIIVGVLFLIFALICLIILQ